MSLESLVGALSPLGRCGAQTELACSPAGHVAIVGARLPAFGAEHYRCRIMSVGHLQLFVTVDKHPIPHALWGDVRPPRLALQLPRRHPLILVQAQVLEHRLHSSRDAAFAVAEQSDVFDTSSASV